jgi:tetratricopeptide (TPR) repeat protein
VRLSRLLAAALLSLGVTGCAESGVVRVFDGREVLGPYISELAYAAYAEAEERAAHGEVAEAMSALQRAAQEDPGSVQIWTRLGAVSCLRSAAGRGTSTVEGAFHRAESIDPRYAPLWRERARCHLRGEPDREQAATTTPAEREAAALEASGKAVALDPDDVEAAAVRATLLLRNGRADEARRLMEALTIRTPTSAESFLALFDFGLAAKDEALAQRAGERVLALAPRLASRVEAELPALRPRARLDAALRDDDLPRAQRIALHARISSAELALRAAALGRVSLSRRQAEALAGADPADLSARVALAVAADLGGDLAALDASLRALPPALPGAAPPALSPLARLLFAELLERRLGPEAARLWLGPGAALATDDALIEAVDRRVRARLEGAALRIASPSP